MLKKLFLFDLVFIAILGICNLVCSLAPNWQANFRVALAMIARVVE